MANQPQRSILKFKDDIFIKQFEESLLATGKLKVQGLGIFDIRKIKAHMGMNMATGEMQKVRAYNKLGFRVSKKLREAIQKYE